jgi:hypothetical protein
VDDVVGEVRWLAQTGVQQIQFIDDNLLPQIAARPGDLRHGDHSLDWMTRFLAGLAGVRNDFPELGWRGIMRLEDYIGYQTGTLEGTLEGSLSAAGCKLIAFGVESGNYDRRKKLKGKTSPSNDIIRYVFKCLKEVDINTKGYFMIGGPGETVETARETVEFAIITDLDCTKQTCRKCWS